jgi:hypothetical protein
MKEAIFRFEDNATGLYCSVCDALIKTGSQFSDPEVEAARGHRFLGEQHCKKCLYDKGLIFVSIPGTVHTFDENDVAVNPEFVDVDVCQGDLKDGKFDKVIGRLMVSYKAWSKMEDESLSGHGNFTKHHVKHNFDKIVWI